MVRSVRSWPSPNAPQRRLEGRISRQIPCCRSAQPAAPSTYPRSSRRGNVVDLFECGYFISATLIKPGIPRPSAGRPFSARANCNIGSARAHVFRSWLRIDKPFWSFGMFDHGFCQSGLRPCLSFARLLDCTASLSPRPGKSVFRRDNIKPRMPCGTKLTSIASDGSTAIAPRPLPNGPRPIISTPPRIIGHARAAFDSGWRQISYGFQCPRRMNRLNREARECVVPDRIQNGRAPRTAPCSQLTWVTVATRSRSSTAWPS